MRRAQAGIQQVTAKAAEVDQKAQAAADAGWPGSDPGRQRCPSRRLAANTVANLDNYHVVTETAVHFGFDKDNLTKAAQEALDQLATDVPNAKGYIIAVEGGTDSTATRTTTTVLASVVLIPWFSTWLRSTASRPTRSI